MGFILIRESDFFSTGTSGGRVKIFIQKSDVPHDAQAVGEIG